MGPWINPNALLAARDEILLVPRMFEAGSRECVLSQLLGRQRVDPVAKGKKRQVHEDIADSAVPDRAVLYKLAQRRAGLPIMQREIRRAVTYEARCSPSRRSGHRPAAGMRVSLV